MTTTQVEKLDAERVPRRDRLRCAGAARTREPGRCSRSHWIAADGSRVACDNGMGRVGAATTLVAMLASGCTVARATPPTSQPAALPATAIASDQRVVAYPHGRWLLYGDGSAALAYAWVWIPTGATPPPPAPPAR